MSKKRAMPFSFSIPALVEINSLPEELVERIQEFAVKEVEEVGPLALVSTILESALWSLAGASTL